MIRPEDIVFPVTAECIEKLQEKELGRELIPVERQIFEALAAIANEAYEAACIGDADTIQEILDAITRATTPDPFITHVAAMFRGYVLLGCERGAEQLKATIDGLS